MGRAPLGGEDTVGPPFLGGPLEGEPLTGGLTTVAVI